MRKRSSYRPKGVRLDAVNWVLAGMKQMNSVPATTTLRIKNHLALEQLCKGQGTRDDVDVLIGAMNMAEVLKDKGKCPEYAEEIKEAQDALLSMAIRGVKSGRWLFTGLEMQAIKLGITVHNWQIDECTVSEIEKASIHVIKAIANKQARVISEEVHTL